MNVVWLFTALTLSAPSAAGWQPIGPERGHVLHAAVGPQAVSVATRVGVVTAGPGLDDWERDPRFPPEVRRLATGPDGVVWGAPAGQIWRIAERAERVVFFESQTTPVDLAVTGGGALLAALRGEEAGVLRIDGEPSRVLDGVDPWCLAVSGERVLLGTVDAGVYLSEDGGRSFEPSLATDAGVSAVAWVDGQAWAGLADGGLQVLRDGVWDPLPPLRGGYAIGIAQVQGGALIAQQPRQRGHDSLVLHDGQSGRPIQRLRVDDDASAVDLTGAWSLPDGRALVGSFRRGPLVHDGAELSATREGFRATVTGGAALDARGRLILALMGTGVYLSDDAGASWQSAGAGQGPVTDSVAVAPQGDGVLVVDFEGVTRLGAAGVWERLPRNPQLQPGQNLVSVGVDDQERLWALDRVGQLFQLEDGSWSRCKQRGLRIDGQGEHLLLAVQSGFLRPGSCEDAWQPLALDDPQGLDGRSARASGGWIAGGGAVWRGSKRRFAIPLGPVSAVAARQDELLVALDDGRLMRCAERCDPVDALPGAPVALGWLPDGRIWAAEGVGTLLVQAAGSAVSSWSDVSGARRVTGDLMPLERAPWNDEASPQGPDPGPQPHGPPGPGGPQGPAPVPGHGPAAVPQPGSAVPAQPQGGCGCGGGAAPGTLALLLGLLGLVHRRRHSAR